MSGPPDDGQLAGMVDGLSARLRAAEYELRHAERRIRRAEANLTAAEVRLACQQADIARLESDRIRMSNDLWEAQQQARTALGRHYAPEKLLRAAAAARRRLAAELDGDKGRQDLLLLQSDTLDRAADVVAGDRGPLYDWLPPHLWGTDMTDALYELTGDAGQTQTPCANESCDRLNGRWSTYCCDTCADAYVDNYEIREGGPFDHSPACNERRKQQLERQGPAAEVA